VDFDLLNAGAVRFSVGAVNVRTGNFIYFDTTTHAIPLSVIASDARAEARNSIFEPMRSAVFTVSAIPQPSDC